MINQLVTYLKSSVEELKKVIWPSPKQTLRLTAVVIIFSLVLATLIGIFGYLFQTLLQQVILKMS